MAVSQSDKMRILYIVHQFLPQLGGTEIYTYGLAKRALEKGNQVAVLYYVESPSNDQEDFGIKETTYRTLQVVQFHYNLSVAANPVQAEYDNPYIYWKLQEFLKKYKPDFVHFIHAMKVSGSALRACRALNIPYFITMADFWFICPRHSLIKWNNLSCGGPEHKFYCAKCLKVTHRFFPGISIPGNDFLLKSYFNFLLAFGNQKSKEQIKALPLRTRFLLEYAINAEIIFTLSAFQKNKLMEYNYPKEKLHLVPHGLETEFLKKKTTDENVLSKIRLGFIGNIVPAKGLHMLVNAFKKAKNPLLELHIYGDAQRNDAYCKTIRDEVDKVDNIFLKGTFPHEKIGEVLEETEILVLPAQWVENEPLVVKAAIYCRVPVLTSDIGSLSDMLDPGVNGWLLPPFQESAWTKLLQHLDHQSLKLPMNSSKYQVTDMDEHFNIIYNYYLALNEKKNTLG